MKLVTDVVTEIFVNKWKNSIISLEGRSRIGGNKLRTYSIFKQFFYTESYVHTAKKYELEGGKQPI